MDLTRPISYRGFDLNDVALGGPSVPINGCAVERVTWLPVGAVGYIEKRSQQDGYDAGDVFLSKRDLRITGTLYGSSRADLYDRADMLRSAFSPTGAYGADPEEYGYLPLLFDEPTNNTDDWPTGFIPKMVRVRPSATPGSIIDRDRVGGVASGGFSIPFELDLEARDPRIYGQEPISTLFDEDGDDFNGSFDVRNRGSYPSPVDITLYSPGAFPGIHFTFIAFGSTIRLTVPNAGGEQILRYNGREKYVSLESGGNVTLRMDLLTLVSQSPHPQIPSGDSTVTWTHDDADDNPLDIDERSSMVFSEAWA